MVREIGLLAGDADGAETLYSELLELNRGRTDPYGRVVAFELERIRSRPRSTLVHDDLSEAYGPVWLKDFVAHAESRGLRRLCEADPDELRPEWIPAAVRERLDALTDDPLAREQLADVIGGRAYRESVLCRAGAPAGPVDLDALGEPPTRWATAPGEHPEAFPLARLQARGGSDVTNLRHEHVQITDPFLRDLLAGLDGTRRREELPAAGLAQLAELALLVS
jgi:hypothetical protein